MNNEAPNVGHSILAIFSPVKIGTNRQQKLKQLCSNVIIFAWTRLDQAGVILGIFLKPNGFLQMTNNFAHYSNINRVKNCSGTV